MKKPKVNDDILNLVPDLSAEPAKTINGLILAPHHTPCRCVRPSEIYTPGDAPIFDDLINEESNYLKCGLQLWLVGFESEVDQCTYKFGFILADASLTHPTAEQLSRLDNYLACLNYAVVMSKHTNHEKDAIDD
jgi:hypothetical protein